MSISRFQPSPTDAKAALRAVERALALHEQLEHLRQQLRCNAAPGASATAMTTCAALLRTLIPICPW